MRMEARELLMKWHVRGRALEEALYREHWANSEWLYAYRVRAVYLALGRNEKFRTMDEAELSHLSTDDLGVGTHALAQRLDAVAVHNTSVEHEGTFTCRCG